MAALNRNHWKAVIEREGRLKFSPRHFALGFIAGFTLGVIRNPFGAMVFFGLVIFCILLVVSC